MSINMKQFLAILWTFELLLHFNQLISSNLQSEEKLSINHKANLKKLFVSYPLAGWNKKQSWAACG